MNMPIAGQARHPNRFLLDFEPVEAEGNEYPLCCNVTDPEVVRTSRCGNHTSVWSNKRITLAFNSTSFDEYSAERYNVIFAG